MPFERIQLPSIMREILSYLDYKSACVVLKVDDLSVLEQYTPYEMRSLNDTGIFADFARMRNQGLLNFIHSEANESVESVAEFKSI